MVLFNTLSKEDISKIIDLELKGLFDRVEKMGYSIEIIPAAKDFLCEKGYDVNYGARPLKRAIQKYLENPMAEILIKQSQKGGEIFRIGLNVNNEELSFDIIPAHEIKTDENVDEEIEEIEMVQ